LIENIGDNINFKNIFNYYSTNNNIYKLKRVKVVKLEKDQLLPEFELKNQNGDIISSSSLSGKWSIIYFYPKDDTPGCTTEACDFRDNYEFLTKMNVNVYGISPDSEESHLKFKSKHNLNFNLLADPEKQIIQKFGAWGEKNMYGKKSMGLIRSTFIISPDGKISDAMYNVKATGHVAKIIEKLSKLI